MVVRPNSTPFRRLPPVHVDLVPKRVLSFGPGKILGLVFQSPLDDVQGDVLRDRATFEGYARVKELGSCEASFRLN
jgi:hypothetical protein